MCGELGGRGVSGRRGDLEQTARDVVGDALDSRVGVVVTHFRHSRAEGREFQQVDDPERVTAVVGPRVAEHAEQFVGAVRLMEAKQNADGRGSDGGVQAVAVRRDEIGTAAVVDLVEGIDGGGLDERVVVGEGAFEDAAGGFVVHARDGLEGGGADFGVRVVGQIEERAGEFGGDVEGDDQSHGAEAIGGLIADEADLDLCCETGDVSQGTGPGCTGLARVELIIAIPEAFEFLVDGGAVEHARPGFGPVEACGHEAAFDAAAVFEFELRDSAQGRFFVIQDFAKGQR